MWKTLGKVLAIAALLVEVVAAIPSAGASLGLTGPTLALIGAGVAVAAFANSVLLAAKANSSLQARQASVAALQLGEVPREMLFGQTLTGGSLVDAFNYGGKYGTDWECQVVALADHECEQLVSFYVNDALVTFTGDGPVAGYNGQLEVYWRSGATGQTVPSVVLTNGPGWTPADVGTGVSWVTVCYKADAADAKNPIWTAGRPAFSWVLKGKKCYQARLDSTVGGAGSHRWSDPSTWAWTNNLIDVRYNWLRGVYAANRVDQPGMLLVGRGLTDIEAPPPNVFAPANLCDELVALDAGGSERRYTANGVTRSDETYIDVEEHFAASCGGVLRQPEGAIEIEPGQAKAPVFFFSDDELVVGSSVNFSEDLPETDDSWVNTVVPSYIEPTQKYADHSAPVRRLAADIIDDGGPREQTLSLPFVTSGTQAGRAAEIVRRLGRLPARGQVTLPPDFAGVEEGDWGVWTSNRYMKGQSRTFRVETYGLDEKWQNTLVLREISADCYARDADAASSAVALNASAPAIGAPGIGSWSVAAASIAGVPAIVFTGATDNRYAEFVRFEYWMSDGVTNPAAVTTWTEAAVAGPDVVRKEVAGLPPTAVVYAAVSYMVGRVPGQRLILGPVTTPAAAIGLPGAPGADGRTSYTHLAYADSADGSTNFTTGQAGGRSYIGIYQDFTAGGSSTPGAYYWSRWRGADGAQGIPGAPGANGQTPYTHLAYASSADGSSNFDVSDPVGRAYLGIYSDFTPSDSTDYHAYTWSLIRGADGAQGNTGAPGAPGANGAEGIPGAPGADGRSSYLHLAFADSADGSVNFTTGAPGGRTFIGVYQDFTAASSGSYATYAWSPWRGADGSSGIPGPPGANGQATYVHLAYANSADGSVNFDTSNSTGRAYLGTYTDGVLADSTNPAAYTWSLIKGADGTSPIVVQVSTNTIQVAADSNNVTKSGQLPRNVALSINQGATDITGSCTVTLTPSTTSIAASYSSPTISITQADASGYIDVAVSLGGAPVGSQRIQIARAQDAPPPASQTSDGKDLTYSVTSSSYAGPSSDTVVLKANGSGQLVCSAGGEYYAAGPTSAPHTGQMGACFAYRAAGSGSWSYTTETVGSAAFTPKAGVDQQDPTLGSFTSSATLTGLTAGASYEVGVAGRKVNGGTTNGLVMQDGSFTVHQ